MNYTQHDRHNLDDLGFQTGDLILFQGNTCGSCKNCLWHLLSFCIDCFTHSKFSHCGIVIKDPNFTPEPMKGLYLLESTGLEQIDDVENKETKFGVQLRDLKEVISNYDGKVFWRKLDCDRDEQFYEKISQAHSVAHNLPYDDGFDYIKAAFDWHIGNLQNKTTFFCSALCTYIYVALEFLPSDTPWSIVTPHDLSNEPNRPINLVWKNCTLQKEVKIYP